MSSRSERLFTIVQWLIGGWSVAAILAAVFQRSWPPLHSFVRFSVQAFLGALFLAGFGLVVVAPGVYMARELYSEPPSNTTVLERRLRAIWYAGVGVIFSALLGAAYVSVIWGPIRDIKLWFIALCWCAVMVPWLLLGLLGRRILRYFLAHSGTSNSRVPPPGA